MSNRIGVYTLRIMRTDGPVGNAGEMQESIKWDKENQEVIDNIGNALCDAEDAVNDQLPDGFYCKIDGN